MVTLDSLQDDDLVAVCVRVPYACHDALRCVCKRLRAAASRSRLQTHRRASWLRYGTRTHTATRSSCCNESRVPIDIPPAKQRRRW